MLATGQQFYTESMYHPSAFDFVFSMAAKSYKMITEHFQQVLTNNNYCGCDFQSAFDEF